MVSTAEAPALGAASGTPTTRIVVIDDDEVIRLTCRKILAKSGYEVETFERGRDGLERIREAPPALLLVDLKMPEMNGFQIIDEIKRTDPAVVMVVITGYATVATAVDAMKAGAYDFLPKPFTPDELRLVIERGLERWSLVRESERLRREKEAGERRFITFVSHQLKSPLVAVKQYLDVMAFAAKDDLPPKVREWVSRSSLRIGEMLELIHDWLALARIEQGLLGEGGAYASWGSVAESVAAEVAPAAEPLGVRLAVEIPATIPAVRADALSLRMVLSNLVGNAVKYNRPGGSVTVRALPADGGVALEVHDTGIGIPEGSLARIFEEFVRVRGPETEHIAGSGLGLTICRKIVTDLGGSIDARSLEGVGSTFTVWLPEAREKASAIPRESA